jgi:hypothetical protein
MTFRRGLVQLAAAVGLSLIATAQVGADCDGPYPSFREAAPTARRVVVGEVVAGQQDALGFVDGRSARFTLRGTSVLDGAEVEIDVIDLPSQPCAGPIEAAVGDHIAIAFDGRAFEPPQIVNAVAWLDGSAPEFGGIETMTVAEVYALLGLPWPPEAAPPPSGVDEGLLSIAALAIAVLLGGLLVLRRRPD